MIIVKVLNQKVAHVAFTGQISNQILSSILNTKNQNPFNVIRTLVQSSRQNQKVSH